MHKRIYQGAPKKHKRPGRNKRIMTLVAVLFAFGIVAAYFAGRPAHAPSDAPAAKVAGQVRDTAVSIDKTNSEKGYSVHVVYPVLGGLPQIPRGKINSSLERTADSIVREFTDNVALLAVSSEFIDEDSTLSAVYTVIQPIHGIVGVVFEISEYTRGAAHPNTRVVTKNYRVATGDEVSLKDMFKEGSDYLYIVSAGTTRLLDAQLRSEGFADWFREGVRGTADNYERWYLSDTGLVIIFDPYQVAPYARGKVEVTVPYSDLTSTFIRQ